MKLIFKMRESDFHSKIPIVFMASMLSLLIACRQQNQSAQWKDNTDAKLRVYFFHLNQRCEACNAVEKETQALLADYFKPQMDSGIIFFKSFNIESREFREIIEEYQVSYTTLLLIDRDGTMKDFTGTALNYANTNPEKFTGLLKAEIQKIIR
jgi:hypothetical protein